MQKKRDRNYRNWVIAGVVGVIGVAWLWMLSLRITNLTGSFMTGYFLALFGFIVMVALSTALFLLVIRYFAREYRKHKQLSAWFLIKLFFIWAAVEFVVAAAVTLVWYGDGGSLDTVLPFSSFTPLLTYTPLGLLSRFVGFYGLSAGFVVLASTLAFPKLRKYTVATAVVAAVLTSVSWLIYRTPSGPSVDVQLTSNASNGPLVELKPGIELTILPEYGLDYMDSLTVIEMLDTENKESFYIGSRHEYIEEGAQNVLLFGSDDREIIEKRVKSRLIPAGEYLPFVAQLAINALRADDMLEQFKLERELVKGAPNHDPLVLRDGVALGSSICASIISPDDYRNFVKNGATVLTNSAMLGIFDSPVFDIQHHGLARFMAVANARPLLQSSTDSDSFALDHDGRVLKRIHPTDTTVVAVSANNKKTPYTYLGEWPAYTGFVLLSLRFVKTTARRLASKRR